LAYIGVHRRLNELDLDLYLRVSAFICGKMNWLLTFIGVYRRASAAE